MSVSNRHSTGKGGGLTTIPCLCVPPQLMFQPIRGSKQVLTIYNPFSHDMQYKVLGTDPKLFAVEPSTGTIALKSSVNVVVRWQPAGDPANQTVDKRPVKLMVEITDAKRTMRGQQVIKIGFLPEFEFSSGQRGVSGQQSTAPPLQPQQSPAQAQQVVTLPKHSTSTVLHLAQLSIKLIPLAVGTSVVTLMTMPSLAGQDLDVQLFDTKFDSIWLAFFLGMTTMWLSTKMFE